MELLTEKYVESVGIIEDINREDQKYRVNVFKEMLGKEMQIKTKFGLPGWSGGVDIVASEGERGGKRFLQTDEASVIAANKKDAFNIAVEMAGASWMKWGAMFQGNTIEANNLRCLKALIKTQYILMRQNNLIIENLKRLNRTSAGS